MKNYQLTIEDGVITWIENTNENGDPMEGILYIPKEAVAFDPDAWVFLGCSADAIIVDKKNPVFSSSHNCLLSKDGKTLIKVCKNSDVAKLSGVEFIDSDAFNDLDQQRNDFNFCIPDGVTTLEYRAFAMCSKKVHITVPSSVCNIGPLAFMIHGEDTHIVFDGDSELAIGAFGTKAESYDSDLAFYKRLPDSVYPKKEDFTVYCLKDSKVSEYCKRYGIKTFEK